MFLSVPAVFKIMPYIYAIAMLLGAAAIAGIALNVTEPRRIGKPIFFDDLRRWYACKEYLTGGDVAKICIFSFFLLLVIYASPLIMTYFPKTNILHYRPQQLLGVLTPVVINHHWATSVSYYVLMWPLAFIPLNIAAKIIFKHSDRAWDLAQAIEAHPALSKVMTFREKDKTFYRFRLDQISPNLVVMYHRAAIDGRELRAEKERLASAANCDIHWIHEVKRGEIHFKLRKAELLDQESDFVQRADGSLVNIKNSNAAVNRYMYFMEINDTIKIGGGFDPKDRLSACETFVPAPNILAYAPESVLTEADARRLFKDYQITEVNGRKIKGNEIFRRDQEILAFIAEGLANGTLKRLES